MKLKKITKTNPQGSGGSCFVWPCGASYLTWAAVAFKENLHCLGYKLLSVKKQWVFHQQKRVGKTETAVGQDEEKCAHYLQAVIKEFKCIRNC